MYVYAYKYEYFSRSLAYIKHILHEYFKYIYYKYILPCICFYLYLPFTILLNKNNVDCFNPDTNVSFHWTTYSRM